MKYYSQHTVLPFSDLFESFEKLDKSNRWVRLADNLPWAEIEVEYNKTLENKHCGASNKPARQVIGALLIKHIDNLSDEKTICAIQENPYMQYFVGLPAFTIKPLFSPELLVLVRKRLDADFFNRLTLLLAECSKQKSDSSGQGENKSDGDVSGGRPVGEDYVVDSQGRKHRGTLKADATCCEAEMKYPTDNGLLEDANKHVNAMMDKYCGVNNIKHPKTHRRESRSAYVLLIKKKHKGKKLKNSTRLAQLRCFLADYQMLMNLIGANSTEMVACFSKRDIRWLQASLKLYEQQKIMLEENTNRCDDRIASIYQSHVRPIVRGKAKAKVEFGAKIGVSIVNGYAYVDHLSWDAYNESSDLKTHIEKYQLRYGCLPAEIQADKIYMNKDNRDLLKELEIICHCRPLGRPPRETDPRKAKQRHKASGERNEVEAVFGTTKRVYNADDIRAKLSDTADAWIGACFFAKNVMKFLRDLLVQFFRYLAFWEYFRSFFAIRCEGRTEMHNGLQLAMI